MNGAAEPGIRSLSRRVLPAAVLVCAQALAPQALPAERSGLRTEVLENGLVVTVVPYADQPLVATQLWYHVGSADEQPGARGLAHLFEHLMFGGTDEYPDDEFERHHHRYGGYENAYTTPDETVYVSQIVPEHHTRVLEMEAARMRGLLLDEDRLENEQRVVTEELRRIAENDPVNRVAIAALAALLGDHPYAVTPLGTKEQIEAATVEGCRNFYDLYYRPANAHLVIVGPVDPGSTLERVRALFEPIDNVPTAHTPIPPLVGWPFPEQTVLHEDLPPAETAILAFPLPPAGDAVDPTIRVLVQLLSGGATDPFRDELVSRRKKALDAGVQPFRFKSAGALLFYSIQLPYRRKTTAFRLMGKSLDELARLEWLTEESVEAAKRRIVRRTMESRYFSDRVAGRVGRAGWWHGRPELAFSDSVGQVTREQVAEVFRLYVAQATPARIYVRPERVPVAIRLFSWLYPVLY